MAPGVLLPGHTPWERGVPGIAETCPHGPQSALKKRPQTGVQHSQRVRRRGVDFLQRVALFSV